MKQCKLIGLTGGIATGKSTVSNIIKEKYKLIDVDKIAKDIVNRGTKGYNVIVEYFGKDILLSSGDIDREQLGKRVFYSIEDRQKLNSLLHPIILDTIEDEIENNSNEPYIFLDIPLLFETRGELDKRGIKFDEIWLVYTDKNIQIERLMKRDGIDRSYALKKVEAQIPLDEKLDESDKILYNNKDIEDLRSYVDILLSNLK